jgi:WW domain-containing oxidoreductase
VLAVRLRRAGFDEILRRAEHSSYQADVYASHDAWRDALRVSDVRLQWDPDHTPSGQDETRRAVQLGMAGETLRRYAHEWIIAIADVTDFVAAQRVHATAARHAELELPAETIHRVDDATLARKLRLDAQWRIIGAMSVYGWFKSKGASGFGYGSTAEDVTAGLDLAGKTILLTGCTAGLGAEALRVLKLRGATVIGTARTVEKARAAGSSVPIACELADPASVHACVAAVAQHGAKLDAIICNAGIMAPAKLELAHGYELQFFTNHIGHFMLVTGLVDQLAHAGRVVMVSSEGHRMAPRSGIDFDNLDGARGYGRIRTYGRSKLANLLFAKELARRFTADGSARTANAVHPGTIATKLMRHSSVATVGAAMLSPLAFKTIPEGAATEVYVATHPGLAGITGEYFVDCNVGTPRRLADSAELAKKLWDVSEKIAAKVA